MPLSLCQNNLIYCRGLLQLTPTKRSGDKDSAERLGALDCVRQEPITSTPPARRMRHRSRSEGSFDLDIAGAVHSPGFKKEKAFQKWASEKDIWDRAATNIKNTTIAEDDKGCQKAKSAIAQSSPHVEVKRESSILRRFKTALSNFLLTFDLTRPSHKSARGFSDLDSRMVCHANGSVDMF